LEQNLPLLTGSVGIFGKAAEVGNAVEQPAVGFGRRGGFAAALRTNGKPFLCAAQNHSAESVLTLRAPVFYRGHVYS
jgi:hypothetical protein